MFQWNLRIHFSIMFIDNSIKRLSTCFDYITISLLCSDFIYLKINLQTNVKLTIKDPRDIYRFQQAIILYYMLYYNTIVKTYINTESSLFDGVQCSSYEHS